MTAFALVCAQVGVTHAESTAADRETARALMADGRAKRDAGDLAGALKAFQAADALMHVPTTAFETAKTQAAMGLLVEARDAALTIARSEVKPGEPAPFVEARRNAAALAEELEQREPSIKVTFAKEPTDAVVIIDGVQLPAVAVGLPRKVNPGTHEVVVRFGGTERKVNVTVAERENADIPGEGAAVTTFPGDAPPQPVDAPAKPLLFNLDRNHAMFYGGAGVAGVGLLVTVITGAMSISKTSDIKSRCGGVICPATERANIDSANSLAVTADVFFVLTLAGAGVGAAGYYLMRRAPDTKATSLSPYLTPVGGGVVGHF